VRSCTIVSILERGVFINVGEHASDHVVPRLVSITEPTEVTMQVVVYFDGSCHPFGILTLPT
jgi:hypothetical protein